MVSLGRTSKPFVSAVNLLDQRDIYKQIIDIQEDDDWLDFMTDTDRGVLFTPPRDAASVPVFHSWFNDELYVLIDTTGATITGSGTTTIVVTNLTTPNQNRIAVSDLIRLPDGAVARIQAITSAGFTALSVDSKVLVLVAGNLVSPFSNAQSEKSNGAAPKRWSVGSLSNRIQLFNTAISITDVQDMSKVEFEIDGKPYMLPYQSIRGHQRHRGDISLAMWIGRISDTLFSDASPTLVGDDGYGVQTTRGMDQYVTDYGINTQLATPGVPTLDDLSDMEARLNARRAPVDYLAVGSQQAITRWSDFFKNLRSSGVESVRMVVNGRELDLTVDKITHGGYNFQFHKLNVLSNTQVINYAPTGGAATDVARSIYFLPAGKTPTLRDGMVDWFRYRYMTPQSGAGDSANRFTNGQTVELHTGALANVPTSREKQLTIEWSTNMGLEVFGPTKFLKCITI